MVSFLKTLSGTITIKKPETNHETWYVNEKFEILVEFNISLERSWNGLFNGNIYENVDWN